MANSNEMPVSGSDRQLRVAVLVLMVNSALSIPGKTRLRVISDWQLK